MHQYLWYVLLLCCCFVQAASISYAQGNVTVKGRVVDDRNGEPLAFASLVLNKGRVKGTATDEKGRFSMQLPKGTYQLQISYIGFTSQSIFLTLSKDTNIAVSLKPNVAVLNEVVIEEEAFYGQKKVNSTTMSTIELDRSQIKMIPNIAGEQDIIKVIQLLPGVSRGVEGSGDFFVRGGDADQNLLLLDGATIYNTGHLFGFISVFNSDVIGNATFVKGAFPAKYGGRLSSILAIDSRSDVPEQTQVAGSIGLISSRLTVRETLFERKMVAMVSARRTYIDRVLSAIKSPVEVPYYFYDVNAKLDFRPNPRNHFFFSAYLGADILDFQRASRDDEGTFTSNFSVRNNSQSFGWKYLYSDQMVGNLLMSRTVYNYSLNNAFFDNVIKTSSGIEDYNIQYDLQHFTSKTMKISYGSFFQTHAIEPIVINSQGLIENFLPSSRSNKLRFVEGALYGQLEKDLSQYWKLNAGYRQSFAITGKKFYPLYEPRVSLLYRINEHSSVKTGYSRMTQNMHRVSSSAITLPVDLWYGVTDAIRPQTSDQWVVSYVKTFPSSKTIFEGEVYYKDMHNVTEYEEGTNLVLNTDFESALLQGKGNSYGIETMLKKKMNKWESSVSYSLNWSNRMFDQLNNGKPFPAKYDRRHNVAVLGQYNITNRLAISMVWEFISGSRFTPVIGQYSILNPNNSGVDVLYIYTDRNAVRLADSHRLDMLLIWKSKPVKKFKSEWHLGVYNVYNRASPVAINIVEDGNGGFSYQQPGIFGTIPTVSYHFSF